MHVWSPFYYLNFPRLQIVWEFVNVFCSREREDRLMNPTTNKPMTVAILKFISKGMHAWQHVRHACHQRMHVIGCDVAASHHAQLHAIKHACIAGREADPSKHNSRKLQDTGGWSSAYVSTAETIASTQVNRSDG